MYSKRILTRMYSLPVVGVVSENNFEEAISLGFADSEKSQVSFELREEAKQGCEALKFNNSRLLSMEHLLEAIYKNKIAVA